MKKCIILIFSVVICLGLFAQAYRAHAAVGSVSYTDIGADGNEELVTVSWPGTSDAIDMRNGWGTCVRIIKYQNTVTEGKYTEKQITEMAGADKSLVHAVASAVDSFLWNPSVALSNKQNTATSMFINCYDPYGYYDNEKVRARCVFNNPKYKVWYPFKSTYDKDDITASTSYRVSPVYNTIMAAKESHSDKDECLWCKFQRGELRFEDIADIWAANSSAMNGCKTRYLGLFKDASVYSSEMKDWLGNGVNRGEAGEVYEALLRYLDVLSITAYCIDSSTGSNTNKSNLDTFLSTLNKDDSTEFVGIAIIPMGYVCYPSDSVSYVASLYDTLHALTQDGNKNTLNTTIERQMSSSKRFGTDLEDNSKAYKNAFTLQEANLGSGYYEYWVGRGDNKYHNDIFNILNYQCLMSKQKASSPDDYENGMIYQVHGSYDYYGLIFWDRYTTGNTLHIDSEFLKLAAKYRPTDSKGRSSGLVGYSVLAVGGNIADEPQFAFDTSTIKEEDEDVIELIEGETAHVITYTNINLGKLEDGKSIYKNYLGLISSSQRDQKCTLKITVERKATGTDQNNEELLDDPEYMAPVDALYECNGNGKIGDIIVFDGTNCKITNTTDKSVITLKNLSDDDITEFLKGSRQLAFGDFDVLVGEETEIKYIVSAEITFQGPFEAKGTVYDPDKRYNSQYKSVTSVKWEVTETDNPEPKAGFSVTGKAKGVDGKPGALLTILLNKGKASSADGTVYNDVKKYLDLKSGDTVAIEVTVSAKAVKGVGIKKGTTKCVDTAKISDTEADSLTSTYQKATAKWTDVSLGTLKKLLNGEAKIYCRDSEVIVTGDTEIEYTVAVSIISPDGQTIKLKGDPEKANVEWKVDAIDLDLEIKASSKGYSADNPGADLKVQVSTPNEDTLDVIKEKMASSGNQAKFIFRMKKSAYAVDGLGEELELTYEKKVLTMLEKNGHPGFSKEWKDPDMEFQYTFTSYDELLPYIDGSKAFKGGEIKLAINEEAASTVHKYTVWGVLEIGTGANKTIVELNAAGKHIEDKKGSLTVSKGDGSPTTLKLTAASDSVEYILSSGSDPDPDPSSSSEVGIQFRLAGKQKNENVGYGGLVRIRLVEDESSAFNKITEYLKLGTSGKVDINVTFKRSKVSGNDFTEDPEKCVDYVMFGLETEPDTLTANDVQATMTFNGITQSELEKFLKDDISLALRDANLVIDERTTYRYEVSVTITSKVDSSRKIKAVAVESQQTEDSDKYGYVDITWDPGSIGLSFMIEPINADSVSTTLKSQYTITLSTEYDTTLSLVEQKMKKYGSATLVVVVAKKVEVMGTDGALVSPVPTYPQNLTSFLSAPSGVTFGSSYDTGMMTFTIKTTSYAKLKNILNGTTKLSGSETNLLEPVNPGKATHYYTAGLLLKFSDNDYYLITGEGVDEPVSAVSTYVKNAEGATVRQKLSGSSVKFEVIKGDPEPEITPPPNPKYYSYPETAYAEVKEGTPGNETFEAMAGVPTTENLYLGAGATEFMVNLDGEIKSSSTEYRSYNFTYTSHNCYCQNTPCTYSCSGHSVTTSWCSKIVCTQEVHAHSGSCEGLTCTSDEEGHEHSSGCYGITCGKAEHAHSRGCECGTGTASGSCSSGPVTVTATCGCGAVSKSQTFTPRYGSGYSECLGYDGSVCYTGMGCVHSQAINKKHVHSHTFTATVKQAVEPFKYLDIVSLDMWQLQKLRYEGNAALFENPNHEVAFDTGYYLFDKDSTAIGTGRVGFWSSGPDHGLMFTGYGNKSYSSQDSQYTSYDESDVLATEWLNQAAESLTCYVTVVSDALILDTTYGYQSVMAHMYKSGESYNSGEVIQVVETGPFSTGSSSKGSFTGNPIVFPTDLDETFYYNEFWAGNYNSAGTKSSTSWITYSGYNGRYDVPSDKWNNPLRASSSLPNLHLSTSDYVYDSNTLGHSTGLTNQHLTVNGLNIIDSTYVNGSDDRYWSTTDGKDPVMNGTYTTGKAYLDYVKTVQIGEAGGKKWSSGVGSTYTIEPAYRQGASTLNSIVVYDPVSAMGAYVVCNPKELDQRTDSSKVEGEDPDYMIPATITTYSLDCTQTPCAHNESCYAKVTTVAGCTGAINTHICDAVCAVKGCKGGLNNHKHTSSCSVTTKDVVVCTNPHHYEPGQPWDLNDVSNHFAYGDSRCWHAEVKAQSAAAYVSDVFINLDTTFRICFPDTMEFIECNPTLYGLADCTSAVVGKGYYSGMDVSKWSRDKFVIFPFVVEDEFGIVHDADQPIQLRQLTMDAEGCYTFRCVLGNSEAVNAYVEFRNIAVNAQELTFVNDNLFETNEPSAMTGYAKHHSALSRRYTDIVGYIGGLTMVDTGDYRYANLFKQESTIADDWLIENVIHGVDVSKQNYVLTDPVDILGNTLGSVFSTPYGVTGLQNAAKKLLPLTPSDNVTDSVENELLRPGYKVYMDVQTIGNYYGINTAEDDMYNLLDTGGKNKMQITPRYWALELDTGAYTPIDIYYSEGGSYVPAVLFDNPNYTCRYMLSNDWEKEKDRRVLSAQEITQSNTVASTLSSRLPWTVGSDAIGTLSRLFLYDKNLDFIGNISTYGVNHQGTSVLSTSNYVMQSQRWFFSTCLPSSAKYVTANMPATTENMKNMEDENIAIVCALDIKVRGECWTLEYDGTDINLSDGGGFRVFKGGRVYTPPKEADGTIITDPIIAVYTSETTSKHDWTTGGSH